MSDAMGSLRKGKVLVGGSENDDKKPTINVYSLRARERPTVSSPVSWKEIKSAAKKKKPLGFTADEVIRRVKKIGDLFAPVLDLRQRLPSVAALKNFGRRHSIAAKLRE